MASSSSQLNLDLTLALPEPNLPTIESSPQISAPLPQLMVYPTVHIPERNTQFPRVWLPKFYSDTGLVTVEDSAMLDKKVAISIGQSILTPKDQIILSHRSDLQAVKDSLVLTTQAAASVSNLGQRVLAREQEVDHLKRYIETQKQEMITIRNANKALTREKEKLVKENGTLTTLLANYSVDMKEKFQTLQTTGETLRVEQQKLIDEVERVQNPNP